MVCGFSQRLQRPEFVRRTKHSLKGHEDTGYSYVVIRRGPRPPVAEHKVGRIGSVGRRELQKTEQKEKPLVELTVDDGSHLAEERIATSAPSSPDFTQTDIPMHANSEPYSSSKELQDALRSEAYQWPRLVFPPLKKSGHIIIDGCTAEGLLVNPVIEDFTLTARIQGK